MLEIEYAALKRAHESGLKIALGTDAGSMPWDVNQAKEFEYLVEHEPGGVLTVTMHPQVIGRVERFLLITKIAAR